MIAHSCGDDQFTLEAIAAVPNVTALPMISTNPTFAQFTYGNCMIGRPTVLRKKIPEAARRMPTKISPNTLNIENFSTKANNTI